MNIVNIGLEILALLGVLLISKGMEAMADADDDSVKAAVEEFESISLNAGFFIFVVFRIIASGCGIGGAYYYNPTLVTVAGISYFALALTSLAYFDIAGCHFQVGPQTTISHILSSEKLQIVDCKGVGGPLFSKDGVPTPPSAPPS